MVERVGDHKKITGDRPERSEGGELVREQFWAMLRTLDLYPEERSFCGFWWTCCSLCFERLTLSARIETGSSIRGDFSN